MGYKRLLKFDPVSTRVDLRGGVKRSGFLAIKFFNKKIMRKNKIITGIVILASQFFFAQTAKENYAIIKPG